MRRQENDRRYYRRYTLFFCLMTLVLMSIFIYYEKSTVSVGDGIAQHYTALAYYGRWLRQVLQNIFVDHRFTIPEWDFSIGLGGNVLTTLHYYCIGDPLALFSAAVSEEYTEVLYIILSIVRLYLAGLTFSMYCRRMKRHSAGTLMGAMSYVFCGYAMYVCFRHPFFINPMIYLPLLLIGAEKILAKERPYLFIVMVFVSLVSNFYFFYMLAIGTLLYVVVRYFTLERERSVKDFLLVFLQFLLYGVIGTAMGCVLFIPVLKMLLSGLRASVKTSYGLLYSFRYYESLVGGLITTNIVGYWKTYTTVGITAPAMVAIFALFSRRRQHTALKIGVIMLFVMLLIPFFGSALNGFSYVCNRWIFMFLGLTSFILATVWPDLLEPDLQLKKSVLACTGVYLAVLLFFSFLNNGVSNNAWVSIVFMAACIVLLLAKDTLASLGTDPKRWITLGLGLILGLNLLMNWQFKYGMDKLNYISYFNDAGSAYDLKLSGPEQLAAELDDGSEFYRTEDNDTNMSTKNSAMLTGAHGTQFYWSMASGEISRYLHEMSVNAICSNHFDGFDARTMMDALARVKYYLAKNEGIFAPYGYELVGTAATEDDVVYNVYENQNLLPFGFVYRGVMSHESYDALDVLGKQESMMEAALIEDSQWSYAQQLEEVTPQITSRSVDYELICRSGVLELADGSFLANSDGQYIRLIVNGDDVTGSEVYLVLDGVDISVYTKQDYYMDEEAAEFYSETQYGDLSWGERVSMAINAASVEPVSNASQHLVAKCGSVEQDAIWRSPLDVLYTGRDEFIFNMGYRKSSSSNMSVFLQLPSAGRYSFDQIRMIVQPMENYQTAVEDLASRPLENVEMTEDMITGSVSLEEPGLLFLSIPYDEGWTAKVDGVSAEVLQVNGMYSGIALTEGDHDIELQYHTAGLLRGIQIAAAGCFGFACVIAWTEIRRKRAKKHAAESIKM